MKRVANCKATFHSDIQKVWDLVTRPEKFAWRKDLYGVEEFGSKEYTEISADGYMTNFTVTESDHLKRWEVKVENETMTGRRIGTFREKDGITEMELVDDVEPKSWIGKLFCMPFLRQRQANYMMALNEALTNPEAVIPNATGTKIKRNK